VARTGIQVIGHKCVESLFVLQCPTCSSEMHQAKGKLRPHLLTILRSSGSERDSWNRGSSERSLSLSAMLVVGMVFSDLLLGTMNGDSKEPNKGRDSGVFVARVSKGKGLQLGRGQSEFDDVVAT